MAKIMKRLGAEYRSMHRPDKKTLVKDTARTAGTAFIAAAVLKIVDTGFAAVLGLIL